MSFYDGLSPTDSLNTIAYGGESNDTQTETLDSYVGTVSVAPSSTFAQTGTYSLKFDLTTNGNKAVLLGSKATILNGNTSGIQVFAFAVALSGVPTSELGVITGQVVNNASQQAFQRSYVRIGTDRKIYLYDSSGIQIPGGVSTSTIPTSGSMREVVISYDSLSTGSTFIKLYMDDGAGSMVEQLAFNSGLPISRNTPTNACFNTPDYFFYGEYLGSSTNRGCSLYLDDMYSPYSLSAGDALHLLAYPRVRVNGSQLPDATATNAAWTITGGTTHVDCVNVNDGTSKYLLSTVTSIKDNWKTSAANPLPNPCSVIKAQLRHVALIGSGAKSGIAAMWFGKLGAGVSQGSPFPGPTTAFTAQIVPSLSTTLAFQRSDADPGVVEWGVLSPSTANAAEVTFGPGPEWVYYTSTLPLGTTPQSSAPVNISVVGTAVGALIA